MEVYIVKQITEADYGCEDTERNEPIALLKLVECNTSAEKCVEVAERILENSKIVEGKKVSFDKNGNLLKFVRVVAAVIRDKKDGVDKIFATARGYGEFKGWWEFPGGKIEAGETPQEALKREIHEELTADIEVGELIKTIEYDYPNFHLSMDCFWAEVVGGELLLKEAEAAKWLSLDELDSVDWLPADQELVDIIKTYNA